MSDKKRISLTVLDHDDPSVGIHSVNDRISVAVPDYLLGDEEETAAFVADLCVFLKGQLGVEQVVPTAEYEADLAKLNAAADQQEAMDEFADNEVAKAEEQDTCSHSETIGCAGCYPNGGSDE